MLYSHDAETALIGSVMLNNAVVPDVAAVVRPEDFAITSHRAVWSAIVTLVRRDQAADIVTVSESLEHAGVLEEVGGLAALADYARTVPNADHAMTYANVVADLAQRRAIAETVLELEELARSRETPLHEVVSTSKAKIDACLRAGANTLEIAGASLGPVIDRLDRRFNGEEQAMGLTTGIGDLDRAIMGLRRGLTVVGARPSMGKAQPLDARVLARHGWVRMGDVRVGDELASVDGKPSFVTGVYPQGRKAIYRVTLSDGRSTRACGEHLWRVNYRDWQTPRVVSTEKLIEMLGKARYRNRLWVDAYQGDHGSDEDLPLPPWVVGAMIANGNTTASTPRISTGDRENVDKLLDLMGGAVSATFDGRSTYSLPSTAGKNRLAEKLKEIGLWGSLSFEKRIPTSYLEASRQDRLALLAGLIDNDGWVETFGAVLYSTSSPGLAEDVRYLVRSLGGVCNIATKTPRYRNAEGDKVDGREHYTCSICLPCYRGAITLERKARRVIENKKGRQKRLNVASVEYVGDEEAQCIAVSHPDHLYVTDDFIVTHNTSFLVTIAGAAVSRIGPDFKPIPTPVYMGSLEMPKDAILERLLANVGNLPIQAIKDPAGHMRDEHWPRLTHAVNLLKDAPLYIDDRPAQTVSHVRARVKEIHDRHGHVGLVMIDYLQKMRAEGDYGARHDRAIGEIVEGLNAVGKEFDCPVVLLSQLNRALEQRPNKRPMMSDLKESSVIEQEADVILFLYRDEVYDPDTADKGIAEIGVAKNREGSVTTVRVAANLSHAKFAALAAGRYLDAQPPPDADDRWG
jgi:replicative DNA helicase